MTRLEKITRDQSLQEVLTQELDSIYYPGYTEEIIASEPERFAWELAEFAGPLAY